MKFALKYPNTKPGDVTDRDTLLVSSHEESCVECGEPTRFIDYCGESYLCSEECSHKHWTKISAACNKRGEEPDDIPPYKPHEKAKIVLVEPGKAARITETELTLENMQQTVGGLIQAVYPWKDKVALVCNDEGKILDLPLNRALADEEGRVYDVVAGTFFICGLTEDNFGSLTDEQAELYSEKFRDIHEFVRGSDGKIRVIVVHKAEDGNG